MSGKKQDEENTAKYFINRLIIVLIFIGFAGTAIFLAFQQPNLPEFEVVDSKGIANSVDEYIWKKYREKETEHYEEVNSAKGAFKNNCYTADYLTQIEFFNQLRIEALEGHSFAGSLAKIRSDIGGNKDALDVLGDLERISKINQKVVTLKELQDGFISMRKDLSRALYIRKSENSFLLRSIAKIVTIEKVGDEALKTGGLYAAMEKSYRYLSLGAVVDSYQEMKHGVPNEYYKIAEPWFNMAKMYIDTNNDIRLLGKYLYSQGYMSKFLRECR